MRSLVRSGKECSVVIASGLPSTAHLQLALCHTWSTGIRTTFDKHFRPAVEEDEIRDRVVPAQSTDQLNTQIRNATTINERLALLSQVTQSRTSTKNASDALQPPPLPDELEIYLLEPLCVFNSTKKDFDILLWWRKNEFKFPNLARMAALFLGTEFFAHLTTCCCSLNMFVL